MDNLHTGCSVQATGTLVPTPVKHNKKGEVIVPKHGASELLADTVEVIGVCDPDSYPLQKKGHTLDFMREITHLRPRSNTFGAMLRVRNAATQGVHNYFQNNEFIQVHTPILTSNDCEGAGELFRVVSSDSVGGEKDGIKNEFFGSPAFLTVSGQLQAEMFACSLSKVYTFGPTFRAENSNTTRHLAEFWMLEPEVAFADLDDVVGLAQGCVQHVVGEVLERCEDDMDFFSRFVDRGALQRAKTTMEAPFARMTYGEALEVLKKSGASFKHPVNWGCDLATEHERYLAEVHCKGPVFVTDYPRELKPFYMRLNDHDDGRTAACVDLLVPGIGELIGGSEREERFDVLRSRMLSEGIILDEVEGAPDDHSSNQCKAGTSLNWYLELRKYGSVPHAGWGLGFERLIQYLTGIDNIRDSIPVPRSPGTCTF